MNDQEIIDKLQALVQNVLGRDDIVLTKKTKFEDLGVSSFGMVQLICAIEDEFDIEIPNLSIRMINSVPAAVKFIRHEIRDRE